MIEAETTGSVSGTSFISGIPVYNEAKKKIVLTDTKFKLKTKNIFKKTLTLLFQKKIDVNRIIGAKICSIQKNTVILHQYFKTKILENEETR